MHYIICSLGQVQLFLDKHVSYVDINKHLFTFRESAKISVGSGDKSNASLDKGNSVPYHRVHDS